MLMFFFVVFLIFNDLISISLTEPWENFVDRLDLFVKDSYLIIQCNQHEIQIASPFERYVEFESHFQCTNKNQILEHGLDRIQIIDFEKIHYKLCLNGDDIIRVEAHIKLIKKSTDKEDNGVDWPFVHTTYTKDMMNFKPYKMKFLEKERLEMILTELTSRNLPKNENFSIYLDFVNRPMLCRLRFINSQDKANGRFCEQKPFDNVYEPLCLYKVGEKRPPPHEDIDAIIQLISPYTKERKDSYTYISDINVRDESDQPVEEQSEENADDEKDASTDNLPPSRKKKTKTKTNAKPKKKKKRSRSSIIIILIVLFCLIAIGGGLFFYNNNQSKKQRSTVSDESQISEFSDPRKSNPKKPKQQRKNFFKLDDEI